LTLVSFRLPLFHMWYIQSRFHTSVLTSLSLYRVLWRKLR
jgi:hypothetical protein